MTLGKKATRSAGWLFLGSFFNITAAFFGNIILTRLLLPEELGAYALAQALFVCLYMFTGFGCQESIVQCRDPRVKKLIPTAFLMTLAMALGFTGLGIILAFIMGSYYGETTRSLLLFICGMNLFQMIGSAYSHHLERHLQFRPIAFLQPTVTLVSFSLGIGAALQGLGVWALAVREGSMAILTFCGLRFLSSYRWQWTFSRDAARWILRFGIQTMGARIAEVLLGRLDKLLVGTLLGTGTLGHYALASRMARVSDQFTRQPINTLMHSVLASVQFDKAKLSYTFERTQYWLWRILTLLGISAFFLGADAVQWLYGNTWSEAGRILQMLAPSVALFPLSESLRTALVAAGAIQRSLRVRFWQLMSFIPGMFIAVGVWGHLEAAVLVLNFVTLVSTIHMGWSLKDIITINWIYLSMSPLVAGFVTVTTIALLIDSEYSYTLWALRLFKGSLRSMIFVGVLLLIERRTLIKESLLIFNRLR